MKKWISGLLCLTMVLAVCASCGESKDVSSSTAATSSKASNGSNQGNTSTTVDVSDVAWEAVGMLSQNMINAGIKAGEGCQWTLSVCYSYSDPTVCFFGTDVGGIYRSTDSGSTWEATTAGLVASGGRGIAVDPKNTKRVLVVGSNSGTKKNNECGLYLSTDMGDTFRQVQVSYIHGWRDNRVQIVYDPSSYDAGKGYCTTVYWSRETMTYEKSSYTGYHGGAENSPALFRSTDGGETWETVNTSSDIGGAQLAVDPKDGTLLAANANGLFRSTDGGKTFTKVLSKLTTSVTTCMTKAGYAWATCEDGVYVSSNSGKSFTLLSQSGYPKAELYPTHITVSSADPNYMMLSTDQQTWKYATGKQTSWVGDCQPYYSHDGGKTWTKSAINRDNAFYAHAMHQSHIAMHPTDKNQVLALGGDVIIRSFDGGANFIEACAGYNGGCWTSISFNVNNPNYVALSNQDYSGAYSLDGGKTWISVCRTANRLTKFTYGAYVVDKNTLVYVARDDNNQYKKGYGKYVICYSTDGGATFTPTDTVLSGSAYITGCVGDDNVVFCNEYRSTNKGVTWTKMSGCSRVYTFDSATGTMYGVDSYKIVKSTDKGATWQTACNLTADGTVSDIAYCAADKSLWVTTEKGILYHVVGDTVTPSSLLNSADFVIDSMTVNSVACDPTKNIIYIGTSFRADTEKGGVWRSTDGGKTWGMITRTTTNGVKGDGTPGCGRLRVNANTGYLYSVGSCRGLWRVASPTK